MKKKLAIVLAIIMMISMFAFAGCGKTDDAGVSGVVSGQQSDDQEQQGPTPEELMADYQAKLTQGPWYHTMKAVYDGQNAGTYIYTWEFDQAGSIKLDAIMENAGFGQYINGTYTIGDAIDGGYIINYNVVLETANEEGTYTEEMSGALNFWFDESGLLCMSYASGDMFGNYVDGKIMPMSLNKGECVAVEQLSYE